MKGRLIWIVLSVILSFGFILRVHDLGHDSLWIDEGFTVNAALETLEKGYPELDSGLLYKRGIVSTYLIAGSIGLFGEGHVPSRMPSVLIGTGFIALIFFFARTLFSTPVALYSSALIALSHFCIAWSRQARMYMSFVFLVFAALYAFWLLMERFTWWRLGGVLIFTVFAILEHSLGLVLIPVFFLMGALSAWLRARSSGLGLFTYASTAFKSQLPDHASRFVVLSLVFFLFGLLLKLGVPYIETSLIPHAFAVSDVYRRFVLQSYLAALIGAGLALSIALFRERDHRPFYFLALAFIVPFLIVSVGTDVFAGRYLFVTLPTLLVLTAYAIWQTSIALWTEDRLRVAGSVLITVTILWLGNFSTGLASSYRLEMRTPQPDFFRAYEAIKAYGASDESVIISPYTQMDRVYLGQTDFWLPISYSGKVDEIAGQMTSTGRRDIYNNTPFIENLDHLRRIAQNGDGFIVLDSMAMHRVSPFYLDYIFVEYELIFHDQGGSLHDIWVFEF